MPASHANKLQEIMQAVMQSSQCLSDTSREEHIQLLLSGSCRERARKCPGVGQSYKCRGDLGSPLCSNVSAGSNGKQLTVMGARQSLEAKAQAAEEALQEEPELVYAVGGDQLEVPVVVNGEQPYVQQHDQTYLGEDFQKVKPIMKVVRSMPGVCALCHLFPCCPQGRVGKCQGNSDTGPLRL